MNRLMVVLPVCVQDYDLMLTNIRWQRELGGCEGFMAVLAHDRLISFSKFKPMLNELNQVYSKVLHFIYQQPRRTLWPWGPNAAFQTVAWYMQKHGAPWLWLESDAMPMKAGWLLTLEEAYHRAGKPFFGPIVPNSGHMNGVGIYPPDTPRRIPRAMQAKEQAWDAVMKREMIDDCYDAGLLIQHGWGVWDGKIHPQAGECTKFTNGQHMDELLPTAVVFHRCKDGSLIEELRKRKA